MEGTKFSFHWTSAVTRHSICVCSGIEIRARGHLPKVKNNRIIQITGIASDRSRLREVWSIFGNLKNGGVEEEVAYEK